MAAHMDKKIDQDHLESQLSGIAIQQDRPLLITDADEVLFAFFQEFERYLNANGTYFNWASFRLNGNIIDQQTDKAVENHIVRELLGSFFIRHTRSIPMIAGAALSLQRLSRSLDIVVLTNIPHAQRADRVEALAAHGVSFPVITNEGSKADAVKELAGRTSAPVFFIDDSPGHHRDVASVADHVMRIHFIGDPRLSDLLGPAEDSHHRAFNWDEISTFIEKHLEKAGHGIQA